MDKPASEQMSRTSAFIPDDALLCLGGKSHAMAHSNLRLCMPNISHKYNTSVSCVCVCVIVCVLVLVLDGDGRDGEGRANRAGHQTHHAGFAQRTNR